MTEITSPDELVVRAHLKGAAFQMGVADGRWRLNSLAWPHALVTVTSAPRSNAPDEFSFRFELTGYPEAAPTACIWDVDSGVPLSGSFRPKGAGGQILQLFREDWKEGSALYAPFDRVAIDDHGTAWADQWPMSKWTGERDLSFVLRHIHDELNSVGYVGI
jgi:hypothetical protein